jgi:Flp pilus assembly protein TadB
MAARRPDEARALALWTASWLFLLLLVGVLWLGDVWLQWPVLLVPVAWAVVAVLRGRRSARAHAWDERGV